MFPAVRNSEGSWWRMLIQGYEHGTHTGLFGCG
jgi:hypothetical protein